MTIDRLSSLTAQIAALRAEMSRKSGDARRKRDADHVAGLAPSQSVKRDADDLRRQLAEIVRGVGVDDTDALGHARERVVKAVLLWEFGQELREHAEWRPMVETIAGSLDADDRFRNAFNHLILDLQA